MRPCFNIRLPSTNRWYSFSAACCDNLSFLSCSEILKPETLNRTTCSKATILFLPFNPFPDDKNLTMCKLKAFAHDKTNVTFMIISAFDKVENIFGKGENAGYQHFLLFPQYFEKAFFPDASKGVIMWERVKTQFQHLLNCRQKALKKQFRKRRYFRLVQIQSNCIMT